MIVNYIAGIVGVVETLKNGIAVPVHVNMDEKNSIRRSNSLNRSFGTLLENFLKKPRRLA